MNIKKLNQQLTSAAVRALVVSGFSLTETQFSVAFLPSIIGQFGFWPVFISVIFTNLITGEIGRKLVKVTKNMRGGLRVEIIE